MVNWDSKRISDSHQAARYQAAKLDVKPVLQQFRMRGTVIRQTRIRIQLCS
jgi:hypothetical protein